MPTKLHIYVKTVIKAVQHALAPILINATHVKSQMMA